MHTRETARTAIPSHPLLLAAYPVISMFARNAGLTSIEDALRPLAMTMAFAALVWLLGALITRSAARGALIASLVVLLLFNFDPLKESASRAATAIDVPWQLLEPYFVYAWGLAGLLLLAWITSKRINHRAMNAGLNLFAVLLVALAGWQSYRSLAPRHTPSATLAGDLIDLRQSTGTKPDIFYIVLDGYGRADALRDFMRFDNSPFIAELEKRGFYVAHESHANYSQTEFSLASTLNLDYIDAIFRRNPELVVDRKTLDDMIDKSLVSQSLRAAGYNYVFVPTDFPYIQGYGADRRAVEDTGGLTTFEDALIRLTPFAPPTAGPASLPEQKRRRIRSAFRNLQQLGRTGVKPKFVVAHIMAPHPPFVFAADGAPRKPFDTSLRDGSHWMANPKASPQVYREGYTQQLQYLNRLVLDTLDEILREAKSTPIIIIQGDHGSKMGHDYERLTEESVRETMPILNAYLVPQDARRALHPGISPVNSFRIALSALTGETPKLLPDKSYYMTWDEPFDFKEVTTLLEKHRAITSE